MINESVDKIEFFFFSVDEKIYDYTRKRREYTYDVYSMYFVKNDEWTQLSREEGKR